MFFRKTWDFTIYFPLKIEDSEKNEKKQTLEKILLFKADPSYVFPKQGTSVWSPCFGKYAGLQVLVSNYVGFH